MTEQEIEIFTDSFERCMQSTTFFDHFYEHFIASSPEVAQKFRYTDIKKQKREVKMSLYATMEAVVRKESEFSFLSAVAQRHSRNALDVRPQLYMLWLESIIHAVKTCDHQFDPAIEKLWRRALQGAIDFMLSKY